MIKSRKGALELSMNTIVVIVIAVVVLSLGLVFIKGLFDKLGGASDIIFGSMENDLNVIATHDQKLSVQQTVEVKRGDQSIFSVYVVNLGDKQMDFTVDVKPSESNKFGNKVAIDMANSKMTLDVGSEAVFVTGVSAAENTPSVSGGYVVTILADNQPYASGGFFVKIKD